MSITRDRLYLHLAIRFPAECCNCCSWKGMRGDCDAVMLWEKRSLHSDHDHVETGMKRGEFDVDATSLATRPFQACPPACEGCISCSSTPVGPIDASSDVLGYPTACCAKSLAYANARARAQSSTAVETAHCSLGSTACQYQPYCCTTRAVQAVRSFVEDLALPTVLHNLADWILHVAREWQATQTRCKQYLHPSGQDCIAIRTATTLNDLEIGSHLKSSKGFCGSEFRRNSESRITRPH